MNSTPTDEPAKSGPKKPEDPIAEKRADPITEKPVAPVAAKPPVRRKTEGQAIVLSMVALLIGIIALALAIVPAIAVGRPMPNPFAHEEAPEQPEPDPPEQEREGGITLKYKSISVTLGGKKKEDDDERAVEQLPAEPPEPERKTPVNPLRWFTLAAVVLALVGLVVAPLAQIKEKHTVLTIGAVLFCVGAITWQYFAVGIAIGAGVAALLIVLAILGQFVS